MSKPDQSTDEAAEFDGSNTLILSADELRKGMYVSYLDRPWTDTTFAFQGFRIESEEELRRLRENCEYVFVDTTRGTGGNSYGSYYEKRDALNDATGDQNGSQSSPEVQCRTEDEFRAARCAHDELRRAIIDCYRSAATGGEIDIAPLNAALGAIVASVARNPDALLYLLRTGAKGDYLYRHAVACAVMLAVYARGRGQPVAQMRSLALGGALLDIGKMQTPQELLNRDSALALTSGELQQLRNHVHHGLRIVANADLRDALAHAIVASHHERHDGKGYPERLSGDQIPVAASMAGIVDMFDAMVSERNHGRRATPNEAMRYLRSRRNIDFEAGLVEDFQRIFGNYPTGSLVELSTGEVGHVIEQNPAARLQPRVYLLLNADKKRLHELCIVDLADPDDDRADVHISAALKAGEYGVNS